MPPPIVDSPPSLPLGSDGKSNSARQLFATLLSLCLLLFLVDGLVSLIDDSVILFFGVHTLSSLRGLVSIMATLMVVGIYGLVGLTPMVPKRLFLPIPLFFLAAMLALFPLTIYWYNQIQEIAVGISICQVIVGVGILYGCRRERKFSWPLVPVEQLGARRFSWLNLSGFVLVNVFVLLPLVCVYIFLCTARAVDHFSEGFMALRPVGFTVQVRKYVRDDGKTIQLFPMAHVANAGFYDQVAQTFPTNSLILMEGVSDDQNLLTNKISYQRMAKSLGLAEQKETFAPERGEVVRADIDISEFSAGTLDFLNLVMLIHSKGMNVESLQKVMQYAPQPHFQEQLFDDLLRKRNEHLLKEIDSYLPQSDNLMVPWGVAHMPGIAREIQKSGFHLKETREYVVIRFHGGENQDKGIRH